MGYVLETTVKYIFSDVVPTERNEFQDPFELKVSTESLSILRAMKILETRRYIAQGTTYHVANEIFLHNVYAFPRDVEAI